MRPLRVGPLVVALALATAVVVTAACSEGDATAARGSTTVGIEISPFFVTLENKAGLPLLDIRVAIEVAGRTTYTAFLGRLENQEKRDLPLNSFVSRDGTPFNAGLVKPRSVLVTAKDLTGKQVEVQVPWKQ